MGQNNELNVRSEIRERNLTGVIIPCSVMDIPGFSFIKYFTVMERRISMISSNCFAGILYHHLGLRFESPFINMWINPKDFLKLMSDFKNYISQDIKFFEGRLDRNSGIYGPVFMLGDIQLWMNHYCDFEEAKKKWYERRERINWSNIYVFMPTDSPSEAEKFHNLEFVNKFMFTNFDNSYPETIMTGREQPASAQANNNARGLCSDFDIWELLINGNVKMNVKRRT